MSTHNTHTLSRFVLIRDCVGCLTVQQPSCKACVAKPAGVFGMLVSAKVRQVQDLDSTL
jgi:hypothetical protein